MAAVIARCLTAQAADLGIQLVGWSIAAPLKTEVFYDGTGSFTFLSLSLGTLLLTRTFAPRQARPARGRCSARQLGLLKQSNTNTLHTV